MNDKSIKKDLSDITIAGISSIIIIIVITFLCLFLREYGFITILPLILFGIFSVSSIWFLFLSIRKRSLQEENKEEDIHSLEDDYSFSNEDNSLVSKKENLSETLATNDPIEQFAKVECFK